jgi:hypothetical protein
MTFAKRTSACLAADRSGRLARRGLLKLRIRGLAESRGVAVQASSINVDITQVFREESLTGNTVPAEEQGRLALHVAIRQDRLGLVVPESTLGMTVDDVPGRVGVRGVIESDVVGDDGDGVGIGWEDFGEDGTDGGGHAAETASAQECEEGGRGR